MDENVQDAVGDAQDTAGTAGSAEASRKPQSSRGTPGVEPDPAARPRTRPATR